MISMPNGAGFMDYEDVEFDPEELYQQRKKQLFIKRFTRYAITRKQ